MRVLNEVDEAPLESLGSGFTASHEQIQTTQNQVFFLEAMFPTSGLLSGRAEGENMQVVNKRASFHTYGVMIG